MCVYCFPEPAKPLRVCLVCPMALRQHNLSIIPSSVLHSCVSSSVDFYLAFGFFSVSFRRWKIQANRKHLIFKHSTVSR